MRTVSDFHAMHIAWKRATVNRYGRLPKEQPYYESPLEMTAEEYQRLKDTYHYRLENSPGEHLTYYGHPIRISREPADTIPIPFRV